MAVNKKWVSAYDELAKVISEIEAKLLVGNEVIDQTMVDRAAELTAMSEELKKCIRMAITECDCHRREAIKWN